MAYFNHAFTKVFLGTAGSAGVLDEGFIDSAGVASTDFYGTYGVGAFGMLDPSNYTTVVAGSAAVTTGKPLVLAASALYQKDKVGKFHGGYQETTKSKLINPRYITSFYKVPGCAANPNIIHVGNTSWTIAEGSADCCHDFFCNKTYYLRVDVKGSPVLRYLTRNAYWTADYYTGCCADDTTPTTVDPTLVMIGWANGLLGQGTYGDSNFVPNVIVGPFIKIVITAFDGTTWVQPGTDATGHDGTWNDYVSTWDPATNSCADSPMLGGGMTIIGCYVDTVFGDCTFYPSDFFQKEPVKIYASEVDNLGDPCVFTGICVVEQCPPRQGMGFGEQVLRDLILSESYAQNYFGTNWDLRIREITQGYDISDAVTRSAQYIRYEIIHSVPRFNNPTGVFDNDQYRLEVIVPDDGAGTGSAAFEALMTAWLAAVSSPVAMVPYACETDCIDENSPALFVC